MSTAAEREAAPPPSFAVILAKTLAFMLLCGIVGPIFLVIYFASDDHDLIGWMLWTGLAVTLLDVGIAVAIALARTNAAQRTYRLQRTGRRGVAEMLSVEQTNVRINDQPLMELHVRIHGDDITPFEARTKCVIPDYRLPLLYAGPTPVLVDPETGEWELDWEAARPAATTVAGAVAGAVPDPRPVAERLAELDDLLQRDLIGREEYDAARARILGQL